MMTRSEEEASNSTSSSVIAVVISQPEEEASNSTSSSVIAVVISPPEEEVAMPRDRVSIDSSEVVCRVCLQETEEALLELGCGCRGDLAKTHRSCIDIWFRNRGSNKCEICQQVAANVPSPNSVPGSNYWWWWVNPAASTDSATIIRHEQRRCRDPLWVALALLIGALLFDILISICLKLSAVPVNIIIAILILLGLCTAFRLSLECCHDCALRRNLQNTDTNFNTPPV